MRPVAHHLLLCSVIVATGGEADNLATLRAFDVEVSHGYHFVFDLRFALAGWIASLIMGTNRSQGLLLDIVIRHPLAR